MIPTLVVSALDAMLARRVVAVRDEQELLARVLRRAATRIDVGEQGCVLQHVVWSFYELTGLALHEHAHALRDLALALVAETGPRRRDETATSALIRICAWNDHRATPSAIVRACRRAADNLDPR